MSLQDLGLRGQPATSEVGGRAGLISERLQGTSSTDPGEPGSGLQSCEGTHF